MVNLSRQNLNPEIYDRVFNAVQENPGSSVADVAALAEVHDGTARRYLNRMVGMRELVMKQNPRDCDRYYPKEEGGYRDVHFEN